MSPINQQTIAQKLLRLDRLIKEMDRVRKTPRKQFLLDELLQAATERYFILAVEIITDIGNHLLVEITGKAGTSYENIIAELGKQKLIPPALAERNIGMARFRNKLVHLYDTIEPERVYTYLQKAPKEFRAFAKVFAGYMKQ